jgi:hypothetical protein
VTRAPPHHSSLQERIFELERLVVRHSKAIRLCCLSHVSGDAFIRKPIRPPCGRSKISSPQRSSTSQSKR